MIFASTRKEFDDISIYMWQLLRC